MITPIYAGIFTFLLIFLIVNVVRTRRKLGVGLGDGGHPELTRAIRMHGNFVETTPWALLLMLMFEVQSGTPYILHGCGILLLVGRLVHAFSIHTTRLPLRIAGMASTFTVYVVLALSNIILAT